MNRELLIKNFVGLTYVSNRERITVDSFPEKNGKLFCNLSTKEGSWELPVSTGLIGNLMEMRAEYGE